MIKTWKSQIEFRLSYNGLLAVFDEATRLQAKGRA
jgi:hypothetical protein